MPLGAIEDIGRLVDQMRGASDDQTLAEDGRRALYGFGLAKPFKWLAAWAPFHIPMIDSYVAAALIEMESDDAAANAQILLTRFRDSLLQHRRTIEHLSEWLSQRLDGLQISPVRVLDSLLWIDWWACCRPKGDFTAWIKPEYRQRDHYELTPAGEDVLKKLRSS